MLHAFFDVFFRILAENGIQNGPSQIEAVPLKLCPTAPFFATFSEDRFFDAFWSPLGSLLVAFGLLLALFWDLGIPKS